MKKTELNGYVFDSSVNYVFYFSVKYVRYSQVFSEKKEIA